MEFEIGLPIRVYANGDNVFHTPENSNGTINDRVNNFNLIRIKINT